METAAVIGVMVDAREKTPEDNIVDLWSAVYGEPPPVRAELSMMIGALVSGLPEPVWREKRDTVSTPRTPAA